MTLIRKVVKKRIFYIQADRKGRWGGHPPSALTVSKFENFDPFFQWNMTLGYSKHILSHCKGSQKCIFHVLNASAIPLSDHFVTGQQQVVWRKSELF